MNRLCKAFPGKTHSWGVWVEYDAFEKGAPDGYRYHRECVMSECNGQQRAVDLVPLADYTYLTQEIGRIQGLPTLPEAKAVATLLQVAAKMARAGYRDDAITIRDTVDLWRTHIHREQAKRTTRVRKKPTPK